MSPARASRAVASRAKAKGKSGGAGAEDGRPSDGGSLVALRPEQLTLRPRPEPAPEALAAITAAAQLLWARPAAPEDPPPAHDAWRFSGRWWAQPALVRRARPWARP